MIRTTSPGSTASETSSTAVTAVSPSPKRLRDVADVEGQGGHEVAPLRNTTAGSTPATWRIGRIAARPAMIAANSPTLTSDAAVMASSRLRSVRATRNASSPVKARPIANPTATLSAGLGQDDAVEHPIAGAERLEDAVVAPSSERRDEDGEGDDGERDDEAEDAHDRDDVRAHVGHDPTLLGDEVGARLRRHPGHEPLDVGGHGLRRRVAGNPDEREADDRGAAAQRLEVVERDEGDRIHEARPCPATGRRSALLRQGRRRVSPIVTPAFWANPRSTMTSPGPTWAEPSTMSHGPPIAASCGQPDDVRRRPARRPRRSCRWPRGSA